MRDFRFRAWDNSVSKTIDWFELCKIDDSGKSYYGILDILQGNDHHYTTMQYTGLKDKNGVDIYEGDVVKLSSQNCVITWIEGQFRIIGTHPDKYERYYESMKDYLLDGTLRTKKSDFDGTTTMLEIVGNIHENPELLGDTK